MNADRGTRYCCGLLVAPGTNGAGVQGDCCRICGRFFRLIVVRPTPPIGDSVEPAPAERAA
jgi:hypothetical protein